MNTQKQTLQEFNRRSADVGIVQEDVVALNRAYQRFRRIYQSGARYTAKEWLRLVADVLDDID